MKFTFICESSTLVLEGENAILDMERKIKLTRIQFKYDNLTYDLWNCVKDKDDFDFCIGPKTFLYIKMLAKVSYQDVNDFLMNKILEKDPKFFQNSLNKCINY